MALWKVVEEKISERGIPIAVLERRLGLKRDALSSSLRGARKLQGVELILLCNELGIGIEDLPTPDEIKKSGALHGKQR